MTDSNNKQSQDGRNVGERNLNETINIHPKIINLSKRNLTESDFYFAIATVNYFGDA
jgi:hypothetical protein